MWISVNFFFLYIYPLPLSPSNQFDCLFISIYLVYTSITKYAKASTLTDLSGENVVDYLSFIGKEVSQKETSEALQSAVDLVRCSEMREERCDRTENW